MNEKDVYSNKNYFIKIEMVNSRQVYCITNKYTNVIEHMEYALPTAIQAANVLNTNLDQVLEEYTQPEPKCKQVVIEPSPTL